MKASVLIVLCLVSFLAASAQTANLVLFSDDGQPFVAYVNGEQLNASSQTNVKKTDITGDGVKVRIVFEKAIPELSKYVMITPGEETTLSITKNKKGQYTFRLVSTAPISSGSQPIVYNTQPDPSVTTVNNGNSNGNVNTSTTTVQTTTVSNQANMNTGTMTVSSSVGAPATVNGNVTVSINANIQDPTITSTTTTTTTSSTSSSGMTSYDNGATVNSSSGSTGKNWESCALDHSDYESALNSIRSKSFTDAKMTIAKQVLKNNCVNTSQVKGMAQLFDFEQDKLAFVKYAYDYTSDKKNYYKVNDVFTYETTIDELNKYLEAHK